MQSAVASVDDKEMSSQFQKNRQIH